MATKKITKKITKATATKTVKKDTTEKKTVAKTKVEKKDLANITNCEDFYCLIRDKYNETNEDNITKDEVSKVWKAFQAALTEFSVKSDAEKATCLLPDVGVLTVFIAPEHESINPRTRETVTVPQKKRIRFRPYPRFTDSIN